MLVFGGVLFGGLFAGATGFTLLVLLAVLWRHMRSRFRTGSPFGGVYAETFAVWIVLYIGLGWLIRRFAPHLTLPQTGLLTQVGSLIALAWPVLRGASWRQVRRDIGWTFGDQPFREPFYGILCYLAALPIVIVLLLMIALVPQLGPKWLHAADVIPIVGELLHADWLGLAADLFGGQRRSAVGGRNDVPRRSLPSPARSHRQPRPLVQRYCQRVGGGLHFRGAASARIAGDSPLTALACGFTAAREWRATLIPSMTVHALHNGALPVNADFSDGIIPLFSFQRRAASTHTKE